MQVSGVRSSNAHETNTIPRAWTAGRRPGRSVRTDWESVYRTVYPDVLRFLAWVLADEEKARDLADGLTFETHDHFDSLSAAVLTTGKYRRCSTQHGQHVRSRGQLVGNRVEQLQSAARPDNIANGQVGVGVDGGGNQIGVVA